MLSRRWGRIVDHRGPSKEVPIPCEQALSWSVYLNQALAAQQSPGEFTPHLPLQSPQNCA